MTCVIEPTSPPDVSDRPRLVVVVESRRGSIRAVAQPTPTVQPGQVFLPMHEEGTNVLTFPRVDPHSRQPAYKHAAVSVRSLHRWER